MNNKKRIWIENIARDVRRYYEEKIGQEIPTNLKEYDYSKIVGFYGGQVEYHPINEDACVIKVDDETFKIVLKDVYINASQDYKNWLLLHMLGLVFIQNDEYKQLENGKTLCKTNLNDY